MRARRLQKSGLPLLSALLLLAASMAVTLGQKPVPRPGTVSPGNRALNLGWLYTSFTTSTQLLGFVNGDTQGAPSEFRVAAVGTQQGGVIYHVFYRPPLTAKPAVPWLLKRVDTPQQALDVINEKAGRAFRICGASTPNKPQMFFIFYRDIGLPPATWTWKMAETVDAAHEILKYQHPSSILVSDAEVATVASKFHVFYRVTPVQGSQPPWGWVRRETPAGAVEILNNGVTATPKRMTVARIGAILESSNTAVFYIFYR